MIILLLSQEAPGEVASHLAIEDQNFSTVKVMCRICFSGENEGSVRSMKMLSCKICSKKYHRSCLKCWAEHRGFWFWTSKLAIFFDTSIAKNILFLQIFFIGVHGLAPLAVFVRLVLFLPKLWNTSPSEQNCI